MIRSLRYAFFTWRVNNQITSIRLSQSEVRCSVKYFFFLKQNANSFSEDEIIMYVCEC